MPHARLPQMAPSLGRVRGERPDAARLHYQRAQKMRQQSPGWWRTVPLLRFLSRPTVGTCRNLQHCRSHARTLRVHAVVCGLKLADGSPVRNSGQLIFSPPLLYPDIAPPWTCAWPPLLLRQLAETQCRRQLIANFRTTETESWDCDSGASTVALVSGQRMGDHTSRNSNASVRSRHFPPAGTVSGCRRNHFIAGGNTKSQSLSCDGGQPESCSASRALRRHRRQSSAPMRSCPLSRRWARRPRPGSAAIKSLTAWFPLHSERFVSGWRWLSRETSRISFSLSWPCVTLRP